MIHCNKEKEVSLYTLGLRKVTHPVFNVANNAINMNAIFNKKPLNHSSPAKPCQPLFPAAEKPMGFPAVAVPTGGTEEQGRVFRIKFSGEQLGTDVSTVPTAV